MLHSAQSRNVSSNHFEALFEYATIGILITDSNGVITAINPFALSEFGYTRKELLGKKIEMLIPTRFQGQHVRNREHYSKRPQTRPMGVGMDLFALKKDGTEFPVEVSLGNYHTNGDRYVIAFITNISVRKKGETEIKQLNDDLEATVERRTKELTNAMHQLEISKEELSKSLEKEKELGELKSRFVSMASHEFRTPLSTILSSAYLIEKYKTTEDQPKRDRHLQRVISSVRMLTDILNDFLSLGKIEERKIQVRVTEFNIRELVIDIVGEIKNNVKENQEINYQHEGDSIVSLDASLLKHMVMNLVSNASKFSPDAAPIEIKTINPDRQLTLTVKDHGIGISREDQKHLMERFFRGSNAGNIQGTGLGLHLVSKYAELMNGTVKCKSELGKGTEFIIQFDTKNPVK
jgi:PAS domain S-box-containing protein